MHAPRHEPARGAMFMTAAVICMVLIDVSAKALVAHYPIQQIFLYRGVFALIPLAFLIWRAGGFRSIKFVHPWIHLARAMCGLGAMGSFFTSLSYLTLIDATAIAMAAPILITALSIPFLGEKVGPHRWAAILVGMIGVVIMLRPSPSGLAVPAALLPLAAAFFYALIQVITRKYAEIETTEALGISYNAILVSVGIVTCALFGWVVPDIEHAPEIVGVGVAGGLTMILMIQAYRLAEASFISALDYTALIWAALLGWVFWQELPDAVTVLGGTVVVAAGLYILRRETIRSGPSRDPIADPGPEAR